MKTVIPHLYSHDEREERDRLIHVVSPGWEAEAATSEWKRDNAVGFELTFDDHPTVLVQTNASQIPDDVTHLTRKQYLDLDTEADETLDLRRKSWLRHPDQALADATPDIGSGLREDVIDSWKDTFSFKEEDRNEGVKGLREPQIGAVHAVHSHWATSREPATVVMPTGTGKTETMISSMVSTQCERILVVVPTDALRKQIAKKFSTLGILKELGVVDERAQHPVVCILNSIPKSAADVVNLFEPCNVIVTTMAVAGRSSDKVQEEMAGQCSHLFIDEAHHVSAPTWKAFKKVFASARILQFTATPYRNDDRPVEGKVIFNYPLRRAQEKDYFRPINFNPVQEFHPDKRDAAIAEAAVEQLRQDLDDGFNHLLMARVSSVPRAGEVIELYQQYPEFNPVELHTGIRSIKQRDQAEEQLLSGESRIVVCVDMLGEGFDLPELKIAAFHDVRKSLPVTIQLVGRFTRAHPDLGEATVIANIAEVEVKEELRRLYQRDVDWNRLLPAFTEEAIQEEIGLYEFIQGFQRFPEELSLQSVRPAMSAVAYRTHCEEWDPGNFAEGIRGFGGLDRVYSDHNPDEDTLVVITAQQKAVDWARIKEIYTWDWQLYVLHWDREQELLFINNSSNSGFFENLAKAVAGDKVELIRGPTVFRSLSGINRLRLQNVGLLEQLGRLIRYTMRSGRDVEPALSETEKQRVRKANIFGTGFENGHRTSMGCSYKGRLWSRRVTNLPNLVDWCEGVGGKLLDEKVDPDDVLKGTLRAEVVSEIPATMPIAVDWPLIFYQHAESVFRIEFGGGTYFLHEVNLELAEDIEPGEARFVIKSSTDEIELTLDLNEKEDKAPFSIVASGDGYLAHRSNRQDLEKFFQAHPPTIWFADGSSLEGNEYTARKGDLAPYSKEKIEEWDWTDIEITKEAQGVDKQEDTIQYRVIGRLKNEDFDVIYDDDGPGEIADVVTIKEEDESIEIELYHCKFSRSDTPGSRVEDLYTVCGQAQKSIRWLERPEDIFNHLLRRQDRKVGEKTASRFERGTEDDVLALREKSRQMRIGLSVRVVQPGVSKSKISQPQLELLAVTENYLHETFLVPFRLIASE